MTRVGTETAGSEGPPREDVLVAVHAHGDGRARPSNVAIAGAVLLVVGPLVLLSVLRIRPELDVHWHSGPVHFWLVATALDLAAANTTGASRRRP